MSLAVSEGSEIGAAKSVIVSSISFYFFFGVPYVLVRSYWVSKYFKFPEPARTPPPVDDGPAIYVFQNDKKTGPFTKAQFKQMFDAGMVDARAKYWHAGMDGWKDVIPSP